MNPTIHPTQSNTQAGPYEVLAGEDLTGKAGCFVNLTHDSGVPEVVLPNDVADKTDLLLLSEGADGELVTVLPVDRSRNVRARLSGTCNPGDELTLEAIDGTHDGQVRKLPAAPTDDYWVFLRAEEVGADGQLVKCRPILNPRVESVVS